MDVFREQREESHLQLMVHCSSGSQRFLAPGTGFVGDHLSMDQCVCGGDGFRMIQVPYIYCALYFYYYYISSISHHEALDPRCWGPLYYRTMQSSQSMF